MAQILNQFVQAPVQGQVDLHLGGNIIAVQIDSSSAGGLIPGQAVKMVDSSGGVPKVVECAANSDDVYGFLVYDIKDRVYAAGDRAEIACLHDSCMYMTSSAAIARNAKIAIVVAGSQVVTAATGMMVVGRAFDKATASGQLIRVVLDLPGTLAP